MHFVFHGTVSKLSQNTCTGIFGCHLIGILRTTVKEKPTASTVRTKCEASGSAHHLDQQCFCHSVDLTKLLGCV